MILGLVDVSCPILAIASPSRYNRQHNQYILEEQMEIARSLYQIQRYINISFTETVIPLRQPADLSILIVKTMSLLQQIIEDSLQLSGCFHRRLTLET